MQIHQYNLNPFRNESYIKYYLLGAFMTDGCVYSRPNRKNSKVVTLSSKDDDWLKLINDLICPDKRINKKTDRCSELMYMSSELGNILENLGCVQRKSLVLKFPDIPEEYICDFLRGCWDGDGSLSFSKRKKKLSSGEDGYQWQGNLTSGSKEFCDSLVLHLSNLQIKSKVYAHGKNGRKIDGRIVTSTNQCWRVVLSGGSSVHNLCEKLYLNDKLSMPRKKKIAIDIIENRILNNQKRNLFKISQPTLFNIKNDQICHDVHTKSTRKEQISCSIT